MNIHEVSVRENFEERIIDLPTENSDGVVLRLVVVSTLRTSIVVSKMFCESEYIFSCNDLVRSFSPAMQIFSSSLTVKIINF